MTTPATEGTPNQPTPPEGAAEVKLPDWVEQLPEGLKWVGKEVQDARAEAARYRTERNEIREQLSSAKSPEEFEALQKKTRELEAKLLRDTVARKHNVPEDLVDFLTATDEAGLEAQAAKLGRPAEDPAPKPTPLPPSGGANPLGDPNAEKSGKDAWAEYKQRSARL